LDPLILLIILITNIAFIYLGRGGALLNIFALFINLIAFFECVSWFDYLFVSMFSILQGIIIIEKVAT